MDENKKRPPNFSNAHATKQEVHSRVGDVMQLLIGGASTSDICKIAKERWDVNERWAKEYLKRAKDQLAENANKERDYQFARSLERYDKLYARALHVQDYKTCLQLQARIDKLLGLEAPARNEHTGANGGKLEIHIVYDDDKPDFDKQGEDE